MLAVGEEGLDLVYAVRFKNLTMIYHMADIIGHPSYSNGDTVRVLTQPGGVEATVHVSATRYNRKERE